MKRETMLSKWLPAAIAGLSLAATTALADSTICTFDADVCGFNDGGGMTKTIAWDGTVGNFAGSAEVAIQWTNATGWYDSKFQWGAAWPGIDCRQYLNLEFDLKVDTTNSTLDDSGGYCHIQLIAQGWSGAGDNGDGLTWVQFGSVDIAKTNAWQHFKVSLAAFPHYMNNLVLNFNQNQYNSSASVHAGPCAYWVDNVVLTSPPLPPPTLAAPKPASTPGLTLDPVTSGQYQRVMVYPGPVGTDLGWYGNVNPVTYSFTFTGFPTENDYAANVFWVPTNSMPNGPADTALDWNCPNGLFFNFTANTDNPATGWWVTMNAKTNLPGANPNVTLMGFNYSTLPNGTWSITFDHNTNFTIQAPNGFTTNYYMPTDLADIVSGNAAGNTALLPYIGIMNRTLSNVGIPAVLGHIGITNDTHKISDSFCPGGFDTNTWAKLTDNQSDIFVNCGDLLSYLYWNAPNDQKYSALLVAGQLSGPWYDLAYPASWYLLGTPNLQRGVNVSKSAVHALLGGAEKDAAFFRLVQRNFSRLQVLLPGETNAPNTLTGKIGTPLPQSYNNQSIPIIINACDQNWHIMTSTDELNVDLGDLNAQGNGAATLTAGTTTVSAWYYDVTVTTNFVITVTDVTTPAIANGVSSPLTITNP